MTPSAAYLRRSTTKQEQSLDGQRTAIEQFAVKNSFNIVRWYIDDGISGSTGDQRRDFLRMVGDAQHLQDFRAVIAYDLSRFGRMDSDETGHYRHLLRQAGVRVIFSNEDDGGDNETGEIIRPVLQAQKRQYLRQISRDTLRGQIQSARAGWASGRAAAFGYDRMRVDETGQYRQRLKRGEQFAKPRSWHVTLVPSDTEREVETLRWIYQIYVDSEIGCKEIARQLNDRGVSSPGGGDWCIGTVREILKNPLYKGWLCFGRKSEGKFHRLRNGEISVTNGGEGQFVKRPKEEWVIHKKPDLVLVDENTWNSVNAKLEARGNRSRRARARPLAYPLSGLVRCADCGVVMVGMRRDQKYQIYACASHFRNKKCFSNSVRQEALLRVTADLIVERLFHNCNWEEFAEAALQHAQSRPECSPEDEGNIRRQLDAARTQHQRAAQNLLLADPENVPALNAAMVELRTRVKILEGELASTRKRIDPVKLAEEATTNAKRLMSRLTSNDPQELKHALGDLVERIDLKFTNGYWGRRRVRMVAGGSITLRGTTLTSEYRGDRI